MMDDKINIQWYLNQIRKQRHDFMNYLQVIYGYLQINKPNEALNYIKKLNTKMYMLSQLYNLENSYLSLIIHDIITTVEKCGLDWQLKNIKSYITEEELSKNINKYIEGLEDFKQTLYNVLIKQFKNQEIFISTKENIDGLQILLHNDGDINYEEIDFNYISKIYQYIQTTI
ncbi:Spo0B domain-containing protein [Caloramator sp. mosi_1]|uniref:Spo0B domain-containing protein n=1 Tax=Caloramator sp. mosi_1 TaxID=3023090 RepID=UPI00235EA544|nr:Spo0B domain-containing protein [Caloramator sp. mosi_1]WDC83881.1 Spo0B domain-containing protein [Caloramator sp. mosi_1]